MARARRKSGGQHQHRTVHRRSHRWLRLLPGAARLARPRCLRALAAMVRGRVAVPPCRADPECPEFPNAAGVDVVPQLGRGGEGAPWQELLAPDLPGPEVWREAPVVERLGCVCEVPAPPCICLRCALVNTLSGGGVLGVGKTWALDESTKARGGRLMHQNVCREPACASSSSATVVRRAQGQDKKTGLGGNVLEEAEMEGTPTPTSVCTCFACRADAGICCACASSMQPLLIRPFLQSPKRSGKRTIPPTRMAQKTA